MKRWVPILFIVAGILVVAGVVASRAATSLANNEASAPVLARQTEAQAADGADRQGVAFIGVALSFVPDGAASSEQPSGGAVVANVVNGSPADGLLLDGDIISAVNGQSVATPSDVVEIVRNLRPGDVLTFTLSRDGVSLDIDVTAGEREAPALAFAGRKELRFGPGFTSRFRGRDNLIKSEVRIETEEGVRTIRTAVGTVGEVDAEAGTFSLTLKDESETIDYVINDDTTVSISHDGDLAGLNTDALTTVEDMSDGQGGWTVKSVTQGTHSTFGAGHAGRGFPRLFRGFGFGSPGTERHLFRRGPLNPTLHPDGPSRFLSPGALDEMLQGLPDEFREKLKNFHLDLEGPDADVEIIIEGLQS